MSDANEWRVALFREMLAKVHAFESDNFDSFRYQGISPNAFFLDDHARFLGYFTDHCNDFYEARSLLGDAASRELFDRLLLFRMIGHLHVRLPLNEGSAMSRLKVPDDWKVADTEDVGMFGPLSVYSVPVRDEFVWVKGWSGNIAAFLAGQYYFQRGDVRISPENGDYAIDAGGCFGDTALFFAQSVGASGHVYTFDPLRKHCNIMRDAFKLNSELGARISIFESGVSERDQAGHPDESDRIDPGARAIGEELDLRSIDSMVAKGEIARVDFIKMDIEGSELAALKGAADSIAKWRPKLAISLYHRLEDFHVIPSYLQSLGLDYEFFLDHYSIHHEETVLYARSKVYPKGAA